MTVIKELSDNELHRLYTESSFNCSKLAVAFKTTATIVRGELKRRNLYLTSQEIAHKRMMSEFSTWDEDEIRLLVAQGHSLASIGEQLNSQGKKGLLIERFLKEKGIVCNKRRMNEGNPIDGQTFAKLLGIYNGNKSRLQEYYRAHGLNDSGLKRWIKNTLPDFSIEPQTNFIGAISNPNDLASIKYFAEANWNHSTIEYFILLKDHMNEFGDASISDISKKLNVPIEIVKRFRRLADLPCCSTTVKTSQLETTITNFLDTLGVSWTKKIFTINGKRREIDIFIQTHNFGIEINGSYWHSDKFKDKLYHIEKTDLFNSIGINLLMIHDFEIESKIDIIKSMIQSRLGLNTRISARSCEVRNISNTEARIFCEANHIQGSVRCRYSVGLFHENKLVQVATFGIPRFKAKAQYELLRQCSLTGITVVGGATKLFKFFIQEYDPDSVLSYANRRYGYGKVYGIMNMKLTHITAPNYFWCNGKDIMSRYQTQKHKLNGEGSENQIMTARGFFKNYDCGNAVYLWKKERNDTNC